MSTRPLSNRSAAQAARLALAVTLAALACPRPSWAPPSWPPYPGTAPTKEADNPEVFAGGQVIWTITIYNDAFTDDASVYISDDVPDPADALPVQPFDPIGDVLFLPPGASATYTGDVLSISDVLVPGMGTEKVVFRTRVLASAADGTVICNRAYTRHLVTTCAGNPPLCGDNYYDTGTRPPGASSSSPTCVTVRKPAAGQSVEEQLAATSFADTCAGDASFPGAGDGGISPGETLFLTLAIRNTGAQDASAQPKNAKIRGTLTPGAGFTILTGASDYATTVKADVLLAAGANWGTNVTPFEIRVDPAIPCPGTLDLELVVSQIDGGPYTVNYQFPVGSPPASCTPRCLDAPLAAGAPAARDECGTQPPGSDGDIDPGEDVFLRLPVTNTGTEDLQGQPNVVGTLSSLTAGVTVLGAAMTSDYPDLLAGTTQTNLTEFGVHVADTLGCGTPFTLRLVLSNTDGGSRTVDFPFNVAGGVNCTACAGVCTAVATATPAGPLRLCEGGTVTLDASGSVLNGCSGVKQYQWFEGGGAIPGETLATYDVPTNLTPGSYAYSVEVSCSTAPTCSAQSATIDLQVDPTPLGVFELKAVKKGGVDVEFTWQVAATATGGYRLYRVNNGDKTLVDDANAGTPPPNVTLEGQTIPDPSATTLLDAGVVPGPPANPALLFYETLAVCSDGVVEGPN
jgi:hypothetical protein